MQDAFEGLDTLFLCSAREAVDRVEQHKIAVDAAVAAGVERIVYLSKIGAAADATFTFAPPSLPDRTAHPSEWRGVHRTCTWIYCR